MNGWSFPARVLVLGLTAFCVMLRDAEAQPAKPPSGNLNQMIEDAARDTREFNRKMEGNERYQHEKAGERYLEEQKFAEALREFDAALKLDPSAQTVYVKKGIALYRSRRPQEAVPNFDKAIELNQRGRVWLWYPLLHKGIALAMLGKGDEAVAALSASIDTNPSVDGYLWRSVTYGRMDQLDKSAQDVEAGLKLQPGDKRLRSVAAQLEQLRSSSAFLAQMAARKGAERTPSGLIYFELVSGTGSRPKATDTVKVHYHGTLPDGSVFDSSVDRGSPASFPLNRVIPCWTEGVQKMKVGGKSRLVCPSSLAYGNRGAGNKIKPGATLLFEVELLGIE